MGFFSKGLKDEFETAVVNEPLVLEPLNVYCTTLHLKQALPVTLNQTFHNDVGFVTVLCIIGYTVANFDVIQSDVALQSCIS